VAKKTDPNAQLDAELLKTARDLRGTLLRKETPGEITMRACGRMMPTKPIPTDWAWLDALSGPVDEDFSEAAMEQPPMLEHSHL
jgi:hypothetical protein